MKSALFLLTLVYAVPSSSKPKAKQAPDAQLVPIILKSAFQNLVSPSTNGKRVETKDYHLQLWNMASGKKSQFQSNPKCATTCQAQLTNSKCYREEFSTNSVKKRADNDIEMGIIETGTMTSSAISVPTNGQRTRFNIDLSDPKNDCLCMTALVGIVVGTFFLCGGESFL